MMSSSLMVVMMLQMLLLQTSEAHVDVFVSPAYIDVGLSPSLDVNCTFSISGNGMAAIISLTVSRGNNTQLASITTFFDNPANVISSEEITADGVINQGGQSYLHLHWDYPTDTQKGTYLCIARGIDLIGQNIGAVNTSVVYADLPDVQHLMDELKQIQQTVQQMQRKITQLEDVVSSLNVQTENQLDLSTTFLHPPLSYNNKRYYVSKGGFQDFNVSIIICKAYGGILAEMDSLDEYHAVQNYLKTFSHFDVSTVYIGGTDEAQDGTWLLPSSNRELPVADWVHPSEATSSSDTDNCLCLAQTERRMGSCNCHYDRRRHFKYMCEV